MSIFVSSLIKGFPQMEEIAHWVNKKEDRNLGVELIAFTHDKEYWDRLNRLLLLPFTALILGWKPQVKKAQRSTITFWTAIKE